jgi:hypothetical protein
VIFAALCLLAVGGVIGYTLYSRGSAPGAPAPAPSTAGDDARLIDVRQRPHVIFRNTAIGPSYGRASLVPLDDPDGERVATPLSCDRVSATPATGFCLQASRGVFTTYEAAAFDERYATRQTFKLAGAPSRTRVSKDGRLAASTVFVSGDSYNSGSFSTRTTIYDLGSGQSLGDLETFAAEKDGQPFKKADFNYWGVTFADSSDRFYATLGTGGTLYLVEGSVSRRTARVIRDGVECPSLSPDGSRIAFKSRTTDAGRLVWRVRVLTFATGVEAVLAESRSIDDQVEWLDASRILYSLPSETVGSGSANVWVASADGSGTPQIFIRDATSPSVVRQQPLTSAVPSVADRAPHR